MTLNENQGRENGVNALSESERARIREEELLRVEARQSLEKTDRSRRAHLKVFLNSSLGIWLLSAVFITGAGAVYQRCESELSGRRARLDSIARLDREISYRLSETLALLRTADGRWEFDTAKNGVDPDKPPSTEVAKRLAVESYQDARRIAATLSGPPASEVYPPLYPQFASYSTPALMAELATLVPIGEQASIDGARAKVTALHGSIGVIRPNTSASEQVASFLLRTVMLPRWRNKSFLYTTCGESEPFCQDSGLPGFGPR